MSAFWTRQPERGSESLLRFMVWLCLGIGWRAGRILLYPITAYFLFFSRAPRRASQAFLRRTLKRRPGIPDLFRHYFFFAATILDRVFFLTGRLDGYDVRVTGLETLLGFVDRGVGCILVGSHLGSFEVLRAIASSACPVPVKALMYSANAERVNAVFNELNPSRPADVISIGTPGAMLKVSEALKEGALIGILGDRATQNEKLVAVDFMGDPAPFPTGPLALASVLRAPVFLFFGIYRGGRRYDVHFELFAERIQVAREGRAMQLRGWVQRYADRLASEAERHPFNWFNFYDFWRFPESAQTPAAA
jgi:predicted LPLAT superfamily acyltransferase